MVRLRINWSFRKKCIKICRGGASCIQSVRPPYHSPTSFIFSKNIDPFLRILKFRPNKNLGHAPPLKIWKWNFIERRGVSKLTKQYFFLSTLIFRGTTFQTIFFLKSCTTASSATFGQLWVGNPYFWPIMGTLLGDHWVTHPYPKLSKKWVDRSVYK